MAKPDGADPDPLARTLPESNPAAAAAVRESASFDPLIGATLAGRYQMVRRIGEGGMGAVYEATHLVLRKRVAVKVLLERLVERTELVKRLLQEARLASGIGHENIVDVTDFGTTEDGRSFVVMEYLDGESLAGLLTREAPLPVARCLGIARQVASALQAAHEKGIVHRDIKPENLFLVQRNDNDFVKVVDFGVSKAVRGLDEGADSLRLTRTGILLGTPLYMSPEQARGDEDIDARADVWALGVVLYECLTGEVPFRASNYLQVIAQVQNTEIVPPSRLQPGLGIPAAVEQVVMRAMSRVREERQQSMAELERDLVALEGGRDVLGVPLATGSGPPVGTRPGRWHLGIGAALLVGVALAVALARTPDAAKGGVGAARREQTKPVAPPAVGAPQRQAPAVPDPAVVAPPAVGAARVADGEPRGSVGQIGAGDRALRAGTGRDGEAISSAKSGVVPGRTQPPREAAGTTNRDPAAKTDDDRVLRKGDDQVPSPESFYGKTDRRPSGSPNAQ